MLASCSSLSPRQPPDPDLLWSLNGRLAVITADRRGTFGLDWQQYGRDFEIDLLGPLGMGVARVVAKDGLVTLDVPGEKAITARNADALLASVTGLDIPVSPMRYWVRGKPAPGRFERTDAGFRQLGWTIEYLTFEGELPVRMKVSRPEARLTLVVRRWEA